jgi:hypothetical protein
MEQKSSTTSGDGSVWSLYDLFTTLQWDVEFFHGDNMLL